MRKAIIPILLMIAVLPVVLAIGPGPNEPVGMNYFTERSFDGFDESGWGHNDCSTYTIVSDSSAPESPSSVGQMFYNYPYHAQASSPCITYSGEFAARSVYMRFWLKLSDPWQGHISKVSKILYLTDVRGAVTPQWPVIVHARGEDNNPLELSMVTQGPEIIPRVYHPNVGSAELVRGQWHDIEIYIVMNSGANSDGELHMWVDGKKTHARSDVFYVGPSSDHLWDGISWNPVWGGNNPNEALEQDQYMWMDHFYASTSSASPPSPPPTCTPSSEVCDGLDNDCDGSIDEGNVCSPPPSSGDYVLLTDRVFDVHDEDGWGHLGGQDIVVDSSAPRSPPNVMRYTYFSGHPAGSGPGKDWKMWWSDYGNSGFSEIEIDVWMKLSDNWYGQSSNSKLFYVKTDNGGFPLFFAAVGGQDDPLHLEARTQGQSAGNRNLGPNVGVADVPRGEWFHIRARIKINTGDNSDGELDVWFNGVKSHDYTGIRFVNSEFDPNEWGGIDMNAVWGGTGDETVPETQYLWVDHFIVRGIQSQSLPSCVPTTELCDGFDDDCDGSVDEGGVCAPPPVIGSSPDVSGDGLVDVRDVILVLQHLGDQDSVFDVNGVSPVNVLDVIGVLQSIGVSSGGSVPGLPGTPQFSDVSGGVLVSWSAASDADYYSYTSAVGGADVQSNSVTLSLADGDWFCVKGVNDVGVSVDQSCNTYHASTPPPPTCTPTTEVCDGLDNDCDGSIDENNVCAPACTPTTEICDGLDNDCDGSVDENNVCSPPPPGSVQPVKVFDPNDFVDTDDIRTSSFWRSDGTNPHLIDLVDDSLLGGKAMRYAYTVPNCRSQVISKGFDLPRPVREVWLYVEFRTSSNFNTADPETCRPGDYKWIFGGLDLWDGRWSLHNGMWGSHWKGGIPARDNWDYGTLAAQNFGEAWRTWDGQVHTVMLHWKYSSDDNTEDGMWELWVDGVLVGSFTGSVHSDSRIINILLGRNMSGHAPDDILPPENWDNKMYLYWGVVEVYEQDPGFRSK